MRNAEIAYQAAAARANEERSSILMDFIDGLTPEELDVDGKICSFAEGFEYSSKPRNEQEFSFIVPPIHADSLQEIRRDMPTIKSLCKKFLKSYNKHSSK